MHGYYCCYGRALFVAMLLLFSRKGNLSIHEASNSQHRPACFLLPTITFSPYPTHPLGCAKAGARSLSCTLLQILIQASAPTAAAMRVPAALILSSLSINLDQVNAFDARSTLSRATEQIHKFALRHSAGLARDLRLVLRNLDQQPLSKSVVTHRVYCTKPNAIAPNSTSPANPGLGGGNSDSGSTATNNANNPKPTSTLR